MQFIDLQALASRTVDDNPPAYGSITGSVVDGLSKEPLPYVNVVVRNSSDSLLTGGITDEEGNFFIKSIPEGSNKVEIQFIGYEKITTEVDVSRSKAKHDLSTISLSESSQQLDEVVVRGELSSVTQKIDRKVINVGKAGLHIWATPITSVRVISRPGREGAGTAARFLPAGDSKSESLDPGVITSGSP